MDVLSNSDPLSVVNRLYKEMTKESAPTTSAGLKTLISKVKEHFASTTSRSGTGAATSLNSANIDELKDGSLVRFRGMVQDMFESEIFVGDYRLRSSIDGKETRFCGLYRDSVNSSGGGGASPADDFVLDLDNQENVLMDRQSLYCVPIPGETHWVKDFDAGAKRKNPEETPMEEEEPRTNGPTSSKRSLDDESSAEKTAHDDHSDTSCPHDDADDDADASSPKKPRLDAKNDNDKTSKPSQHFNFNFPLPNEKGPAVIVKIYDQDQDFKVCDIYDFVGILSLDPVFAVPPPSDCMPMELSSDLESQAHSPPSSLVPRLHVIHHHKIDVNNPLLPSNLKHKHATDVATSQNGVDLAELHCGPGEMVGAKESLLTLLEALLMGDALAARYLLCHLISGVHSRRDVRPIGKMTLNLSSLPVDVPFARRVSQVLELFAPMVDRLPLTLSVLNGSSFLPTKDYEANRLLSSRLQLSKGTEIVVDETVLSPGQLGEKGIRNLTTLGTLIQWQKLDYDFKWTSQEFHTDLRLIILSEGKSILPSDFLVPLQVSNSSDDWEENLEKIVSSLSPPLLARLRLFLGFVQTLAYDVDASTQAAIEEDFVQARAENEQNMTVADFERLLLLSRYTTLIEAAAAEGTLSMTTAKLSLDVWNECKDMERRRKERLPSDVPGEGQRVGVEI